jgi:hypothetical protein
MICASFGRRKRCGGGKRRRLNGCHAKGEREENGEGVRCLVRGQLEEKEGGLVHVALELGGLSASTSSGAAVPGGDGAHHA